MAVLAVALATSISGCGGGGSSGATTTPPSTTPPPVPLPGSMDAAFLADHAVFGPDIGVRANAIALQPDGRIIAAGTYAGTSQGTAIAIARYNTGGTVDSGFGDHGSVLSTAFLTSTDAEATGVVLQPDGKIVMAGFSLQAARTVCTIVRLNADGSPDAGFGVGGVVARPATSLYRVNTKCSAPIVVAGGKIVAAAAASGDAGYFGLMRFNADGTPDSTFGVGGVAVIPTTTRSAQASSVIVQSDGRIVVGGGNAFTTDNPRTVAGEYLVARFDPAGALDPTFGQGGVVSGSVQGSPGATVGGMALQPDGKIIVATSSNVMRFLPDGASDPRFGVDGTGFALAGASRNGPVVALQTNGRIVVAVSRGTNAGGLLTSQLLRLSPDGLLDPSFGDGGLVWENADFGNTVVIQPDGKIVVAGQGRYGLIGTSADIYYFLVNRYLGDPATPASP